MLLKIKYILLLLIVSSNSHAQFGAGGKYEYENLFELIATENPNIPDADDLEFYRQNKIYLPNSNVKDLSILPLISPILATKIVKYLKIAKNPTFDDIFKYCEMTPTQMQSILDYCTLEKEKSNMLYYRVRVSENFHNQRGFENESFLGNSITQNQRLGFTIGDFFANVSTVKSVGEPDFFNRSNINLSYKSDNFQIHAGDFTFESGYGLLLGQTFRQRKGALTIQPALQIGRGFRNFNSSLDYRFFRGIGANYSQKLGDSSSLSINSWVSNSPRSSTVNQDGTSQNIYTGLRYRTPSEISRLNQLEEKAYGANTEFRTNKFIIGGNFFNLNYSREIIGTGRQYFTGKEGNFKSIYSYYLDEDFTAGFENAYDDQNNMAFIGSVVGRLGLNKLAINARYYSPKYQAPYGNGFANLSTPQNEMGIYTALKTHVDIYDINLYCDFYQQVKPTLDLIKKEGMDLFAEVSLKVFNGTITLRGRNEVKYENYNLNGLRSNIRTDRISFRSEIYQKFLKTWELRLRREFVVVRPLGNTTAELTEGASVFFELKKTFLDEFWVSARYTRFNSDDFESAIYQFEYYFNGYMITYPLYGEGSRYLIRAGWEVSDFIKFNLAWAFMGKNKVEVIGTGLDASTDDYTSRLFLQTEIKL